jgi:hypothetical protein
MLLQQCFHIAQTQSDSGDYLAIDRGMHKVASASGITRYGGRIGVTSPTGHTPISLILEQDFIANVHDALQYISYFHSPDFLHALFAARQREESPAARDALEQILINGSYPRGVGTNRLWWGVEMPEKSRLLILLQVC